MMLSHLRLYVSNSMDGERYDISLDEPSEAEQA